MGRAKHFCPWSPADIVIKEDISRIEIRLWADPDVAANLARAIESSLDHRLGSNEDAVPELHRLRVLHYDAGSDLQIVTYPFAHSLHENAAHHEIEGFLSRTVFREHPQQLDRTVRLFQVSRQSALPVGIFAKGAQPEACRNLFR